MKNEEIVKALRCVSTAGSSPDCEHCPYWMEESVPAEMRDMVGEDVFHSCDIDRIGLDGADLIEKLTDRCARYAEEIAVAQDRTRWIPVEERLPEDPVQKVLVFVPHPHGNIVDAGRYLGADGWVLEGWCLTQSSVTHWMPLPEPPEEER